ncbi:MAG: hemerythrin domain-containing protein [Acidimicrobiales bacterium]
MEGLPNEQQRPQWLAKTTRPLDHEALLTLARKVRAAASDADPSRMEQAAKHFTDALDRHLRAETSSLDRIAPAEARILKKGQDRICALASGLVSDAGRHCPPTGRDCESRAQELVALLSLQARDERHVWGSQAA